MNIPELRLFPLDLDLVGDLGNAVRKRRHLPHTGLDSAA
jgi:hypothetical protein